jgi:hypothetical protein
MPRWIVKCPECEEIFTFTEIEPAIIEQAYHDPFGVMSKPKMRQTGEKRTCPNCGTESIFYRYHLFYREDSRGRGG